MRQICVILVCHEYGHVWVEELAVNLSVPQIKFVIKVLFMTPNYVTITPFQCVSLTYYNSEDKKTK
jgi:hypothetical protein